MYYIKELKKLNNDISDLSKNKSLSTFILFYLSFPYTLYKLKTWTSRYLYDTIETNEYDELRKHILKNKLLKTNIINYFSQVNEIIVKIRKEYWNDHIENILLLRQRTPTLNIAKNSNFTAVIVETRKHPHFKVVVENVILNTQHLGVCLQVYHGTENEVFVKDCLKEHSNIKFINLNVENLDIEAYNKIMLSKKFYQNIDSEHILVFQTDVITFKPLDKQFLAYDYIGAPWKKEFHHKYNAEVGNGGLSIRSKKAMLNVLEQNIVREKFIPEDLYLSRILTEQHFKIAPFKIALEFATEDVFNPNAFGCHKSWELIKMNELKILLK
ncbi:DUF5672 family protein [Wenyingzhuangia sp. chi5]|uniref:DUF5672 family protein n=1 Tax=Wenyingzhuangia gilva TaxID=3057677 RepID=A0ABT8VNB9_9FLAO|nr:DUF5672 family protein [Wenyingzhuangia sp. chi5]MDO3693452.1 DUF5672 family protein [Wenyingzhuangia sp. chi5]